MPLGARVKVGVYVCLGLECDMIGEQVGMRFQTGGDVKRFAYITLEMVDKVHRLAVSMGSYGVSEVGTRAGK